MQHYQRKILERFMKPADLEALDAAYKQNRKHSYAKEPNKQDYKVAEFAVKFGSAAAADKFSLKWDNVNASIKRVAVYEWKKTVKSE